VSSVSYMLVVCPVHKHAKQPTALNHIIIIIILNCDVYYLQTHFFSEAAHSARP
jgi:hypothetical protein